LKKLWRRSSFQADNDEPNSAAMALVRQPSKLTKADRSISVVIPCFNEEANISQCIDAVLVALRSGNDLFEIIAVNDGSRDATLDALRSLERKNPEVVVLDMMRNFGQTAAYQAGLTAAQGSHIVLFSGDLEIPADQILKVVEQIDAGYDFVNTSRTDRWGGSHALKSRLANSILNRISGLKLSDRGSGLKGLSRQLADSLRLYGEWHRFLPDLASIYTSRIAEFDVPFQERKGGVSSYQGKIKSLAVFLDLATVAFTVHSRRKPYYFLPGRLFGFTGLTIGLIGFVISGWLVIQKVFFGATLSDRPLFLISIMTTIVGLMMVMFGMLGELILQIYVRQDVERGQHSRLMPSQRVKTGKSATRRKRQLSDL
jgi:glycosyltransferase involved in cell wall biosynthesis